MPTYGRVQVAEPLSNLRNQHIHDGSALKETDHETPLGVLDQEDLLSQAIHVSHFIKGAKDVDALGSCTAQASTAEIAFLHDESEFVEWSRSMISERYVETASSYADVHGAERSAIAFYHVCTDQTGNSGEEWPPTDCGSSGPYIASECERLKVIAGQKVCDASQLVSMMQGGGALMGSPWFYSWEEPDSQGFIDGSGSATALEAAEESGLAGGHETRLGAIEKLTLLPTGEIDALNTVIRGRNSWDASWGDHGCYRVHLSTLIMLNPWCDFRQFHR